MSELQIAEIERVLTQFGGALDGAAGDIRAVSTRSIDLLPTVARVAELLHSELDLSIQLARLLTRLEVGIPGAAVALATHAGSRLGRGDYLSLIKSGLCDIEVIEGSSDDALLVCLRNNQQKLAEVRTAVQAFREQEADPLLTLPLLPLYDR